MLIPVRALNPTPSGLWEQRDVRILRYEIHEKVLFSLWFRPRRIHVVGPAEKLWELFSKQYTLEPIVSWNAATEVAELIRVVRSCESGQGQVIPLGIPVGGKPCN